MNTGNEIALRQCRFLSDDYFNELYETFIEAFSDYVFPFALTETQFRNHIVLNSVDLSRTIGCFDDGKLVGFSLNGFGEWKGRQTVYDAGTGVIPSMRRRGISEAMFEMMLPVFREQGIEQCLLEVVTTNDAAVKLYEKLGFEKTRELALLQCDGELKVEIEPDARIEIHEIGEPDWDALSRFWDGLPSWQNSMVAIKRSQNVKRIIGAFFNGNCVGYAVFSSKFSRIAQLAVEGEHRHRGVATALIRAIKDETDEGFSMQVINIDKQLTNSVKLFNDLGFYERLAQFEMLKRL